MEKEIGWLLKEKYGGVETPGFQKDIERLKGGEPLAYVIGFVDFLGCKIDLSKRPLIPRPETEFWVEQAISQTSPVSRGRRKQTTRVLDIFAGSGCVGVSIMRHIKNARVVFAEKDKKLISQIKLNCKNNGIPAAKYKVIQSDIFENVKGKFDYIFANPPYIPSGKRKTMQLSVKKYEPHAALFGGDDGLFYIKKFLAHANGFLKPGGKIYLEFDSTQKLQIEKILKKLPYKTWQFHKDQYSRWRWIVIES